MTAGSWIELTQAHTEERTEPDPGSITLHQWAQAVCTTGTVPLTHRRSFIYSQQFVGSLSCGKILVKPTLHPLQCEKCEATKNKSLLCCELTDPAPRVTSINLALGFDQYMSCQRWHDALLICIENVFGLHPLHRGQDRGRGVTLWEWDVISASSVCLFISSTVVLLHRWMQHSE